MQRRELLKSVGVTGIAAAASTVALGAMPSTRAVAAGVEQKGSLQATLDTLRAKHKVAGASVASYENGQLTLAASGMANAQTGVPLTTDTIMHIGSITKVFTTTLLMKLVDEQLIDLDKPVLTYLPNLRTQDMEALRKITVAMLVNHTSGIDGELLPDFGPDNERIVDAIPRFQNLGQLYEPGKYMSYCNAAVVLAGYLCQVIRGKSWYSLVEEQIFKPLGMAHAITQPDHSILHRASVGHYNDPKTREPVRSSRPFLPMSWAPAGMTLMASAADLVTFVRMHNRDGVGPNGTRVLSAASAQRMRKKTAAFAGADFDSVGLGWLLGESQIVRHDGGGPGIRSFVCAHPPTDSVLAVLTNTSSGGLLYEDLATRFLTARGAKPLKAAAKELVAAATHAPVQGAPYIGRYENVVMTLDVSQRADQIFLTLTMKQRPYEEMPKGSVTAPLQPIGDGTFASAPGTALSSVGVIKFLNPNKLGQTQHLATGGRLYKRTA